MVKIIQFFIKIYINLQFYIIRLLIINYKRYYKIFIVQYYDKNV